MFNKTKNVRLGLLLILGVAVSGCNKEREMHTNLEHAEKNYWKGNYFVQETIKDIDLVTWTLKAKVDGKWGTFQLVDLPDDFVHWSVGRRLETLDRVRNNQPPSLSGPHNGMVASYGIRRKDSRFIINNAVKGMGYLPKPERVKELIKLLETTIDSSDEYKLNVLENLYKNVDQYFTRKGLVSLELYTNPRFETHTFLNEMENPAVSIVFLDIPSFEVRALARLLHPEDPSLSEYEKDIVKYANLIHSYFHGHFDRDFIAVIYFVVEVFDNTPRRGGLGKRVVPPLP
uniref:Uncharacterized protein n=1 Tax=candidate division WOR-3 bacterium TaxID=2052148 RepID=A0A7V3ZZL6_UNCW3